MKRAALALFVAVLSFSAGGVTELLLPEPCALLEDASAPSDESCPSTCVRCHCGRAFELAVLLTSTDSPRNVAVVPAPFVVPPPASPHDILHVPRPHLG